MKEIKTSDIKILPEDTKKFIALTNAIVITFGIITLIIILGANKESTRVKEYTYTTAMLIETKQNSYQWVPRYGGRVEARYEYVRTYEYTDELGEVYRFTINMADSDSSKYLEVDVRYKDNNPDTLQFNIGQLQDRHKDAWVFYKR